jgi:hypothetical protein
MARPSRHALFAFLVVALVCCTSWGRPRSFSAELLQKRPASLRVTLTDGRRFDVERPVARGDTLAGDTLVYRGDDRVSRAPVAIPISSIQSVSEREGSAGRTALLGIGVGAAVVGVVAIIAEEISHSIMSGDLGGGAGCAGPKETWPD